MLLRRFGARVQRRRALWPSARSLLLMPSHVRSAPAAASMMRAFSTAESDTIYALSSAEGKAGVAVIRISGEEAEQCLQALSKTEKLPDARM